MKKIISSLSTIFFSLNLIAQCGAPEYLSTLPEGTSIKLIWNTVAGAKSYMVKYSLSNDEWKDLTLSDTIIKLDRLPKGSYRWMVKAICEDGSSDSSIGKDFEIPHVNSDNLPTDSTPSEDGINGRTTPPAGSNTNASDQGHKQQKSFATATPDLSINFAGQKTTWGNINPVINFGINKEILNETGYLARWTGKNGKKKKIPMAWLFQIGPYMGSQFPIKDSSGYIPSLFLPGSGIQINNYFTFPANNVDKFSVTISPANFGVKVMSGFTDSTVSIIQHSIRTSVVLDLWNIGQATFQYTHSWHNLTTESEERFKDIFKTNHTDFSYITATIGAKISNLSGQNNAPLYFVLRIQSATRNRFKGDLPNRRIVGFGLIANLDFRAGTHPGLLPIAPRN